MFGHGKSTGCHCLLPSSFKLEFRLSCRVQKGWYSTGKFHDNSNFKIYWYQGVFKSTTFSRDPLFLLSRWTVQLRFLICLYVYRFWVWLLLDLTSWTREPIFLYHISISLILSHYSHVPICLSYFTEYITSCKLRIVSTTTSRHLFLVRKVIYCDTINFFLEPFFFSLLEIECSIYFLLGYI